MGHTRLVPDLFLSPADTRLTQNPKKKSADMSPKKVPGVKNRSTNDDRRITFLLQPALRMIQPLGAGVYRSHCSSSSDELPPVLPP